MSPIFTFIVIMLFVLAIFDIIVGVANDAVNFLNSAIGSRIAPMKVILGVAAVGILVGTLTSSGMMEVARSGVFHPGQFTFSDIMLLFLGMIIADIFLLDIFNSLGLPTSTTVSMVFNLLGSAVGIAIFKIAGNDLLSLSNLGEFINTQKAMAIISAILLSVVLSFFFGLLFMALSRLIFSFRYNPLFKKFGALWCGISFAGIIYFSIFKGLKSTGLISPEIMMFIQNNMLISLVGIWIAASAILGLLQLLKVNILRVTILTGTFSLALAFAGNDLVNFIGVTLAGYESYNLAQASGDVTMTMGALLAPAKANFWMLAGAGLIMTLTLIFSRKAMNVTQTELSLANQNDNGKEKFRSTVFSRAMVQVAFSLNKFYVRVTPQKVQKFVEKRFEQLPAEERGAQTYDLIRATVNLTAASILISIATSFKLPLSTTYVVFMVAMGSSLADKAWGRESAVYRISGVTAVVGGWFLTAIVGFILSAIIASIIIWGGNIAVILISTLCLYVVIKSNFFGKKKKKDEDESSEELFKDGSNEDILLGCSKYVMNKTESVISIYNRTLVALANEDRRELKSITKESKALYEESKEHKYNHLMPTLQSMEASNINTGHFYVQVVDYLNELSKSLLLITEPSLAHIANHHQGLTEEQKEDLMIVNQDVETIYESINTMLTSRNFNQFDTTIQMCDASFEKVAVAIKHQLRRIKNEPSNNPTKLNILYLTLLNETKSIILQSRNLVKSQKYFLADSNN